MEKRGMESQWNLHVLFFFYYTVVQWHVYYVIIFLSHNNIDIIYFKVYGLCLKKILTKLCWKIFYSLFLIKPFNHTDTSFLKFSITELFLSFPNWFLRLLDDHCLGLFCFGCTDHEQILHNYVAQQAYLQPALLVHCKFLSKSFQADQIIREEIICFRFNRFWYLHQSWFSLYLKQMYFFLILWFFFFHLLCYTNVNHPKLYQVAFITVVSINITGILYIMIRDFTCVCVYELLMLLFKLYCHVR